MAQSRFYSATAQPTVLTANVTPTTTIIQAQQTVGFPPNTPYILALDYGTPSEEVVLVTAAAGTNLTVTRGYDGTSATSHNAGAAVRHTWTALDGNDSRFHEGSTSGVHGVAGDVVGTTDTQTLTNKTLTAPSINGGTATGTTLVSPVFSGTVNLVSPNITGTVTGGASYTSPTLTAPVINGTVTGTGNYASPTISGTVLGNASYSAITCTTPVISTTPLTVKALPGQTNPIQIWANAASLTLSRVRPTGELSSDVGLQCGTSNQFAVSSTGATVAPTYRATSMVSASAENTTSFFTSSTSYSAMAGTITVIVPPSGKVAVSASCRMFGNLNNGEMWASVTVSGSVSGTIRSTNDSTAMYFAQSNGGNNSTVTCAQSFNITSANVGETLTIGMSGRAGTTSGLSVSSDYRSLQAIPLLG